jgi:hypothetical protein
MCGIAGRSEAVLVWTPSVMWASGWAVLIAASAGVVRIRSPIRLSCRARSFTRGRQLRIEGRVLRAVHRQIEVVAKSET